MESACRDGTAPGFLTPSKDSSQRGAQSQPRPLLLQFPPGNLFDASGSPGEILVFPGKTDQSSLPSRQGKPRRRTKPEWQRGQLPTLPSSRDTGSAPELPEGLGHHTRLTLSAHDNALMSPCKDGKWEQTGSEVSTGLAAWSGRKGDKMAPGMLILLPAFEDPSGYPKVLPPQGGGFSSQGSGSSLPGCRDMHPQG